MQKHIPPVFSADKVNSLLDEVLPFIENEPTIKKLISKSVILVGDIHGDFDSLLRCFGIWREKAEHIIFLGDIVDRGSHQVETLATLLYVKKRHPEKVHLIRGNHETKQVCRTYGFMSEAKKFSKRTFENSLKIFAQLPYAMILNEKFFLVHGGIAKKKGKCPAHLDDLFELQKTPNPDSLALQLLWNDPVDNDSWFEPNYYRGQGTFFYGKSAVDAFLSENDLSTIIRAHEVKKKGYEQMFEGRLWTVFSSNDYYSVTPHVLLIQNSKIIPTNVYEYEASEYVTNLVSLLREV